MRMNKKNLKFKNNLYEILISLVFFFSTLIFYKIFLIKPYYNQFIDLYDSFKLIFALILLSIFSIFYFNENFLSNFVKKIFLIFFVLIFIPTLAIFVFVPNTYFFLFVTIISLIVIIFFADFTNLDFFLYENKFQLSQKLIFKILLYFNLIFFIFSLFNTNFNLMTFEVDNFSRNRNLLEHGKIRIYINSITTTTLLPICLVFSLHLKRYFSSIVLFSLFIFYGLTLSVKILILMPFGILIFFIFYDYKNFINLILLIITGSLLISSIEILNSYFNGFAVPETLFANYIGRRLFFIPSFNNFIYLLEYNSKVFSYWSQSKITLGLVDSVYTSSIPKFVGLKYFGKSFSVNVGWIGAGYANMGVIGVMVYSIIIGLYFSILKTLSKKFSVKLISTASFVSIMYFLSSDVLTIFFTYGTLILIFILLITKKNSVKV